MCIENYEIVRRVAESKGDSDVVNAEKNLRSLLSARGKIMAAKAAIQQNLIDKVKGVDCGASRQEQKEFEDAANQLGHASEGDSEAAAEDVYHTQVGDIAKGDMSRLLSDINACGASQSERAALYSESNKEASDEFRQDLLRHLAGSIVVKEHRIRYQKEQFDRFIASLSYWDLKDNNKTLLEFSKSYSQLMGATTQSSHSYRCPKIEANYDDFGEQTIRPLNATIFFYFFSANRSGKTWAQWMLSSVRYPNDRMRRAYMRFFA